LSELFVRPLRYRRTSSDSDRLRRDVQGDIGPVNALYESVARDAEREAALDRDFRDFATRANSVASDGSAEYHYGYLLVVARKRRT
jgi:hypothetical protein